MGRVGCGGARGENDSKWLARASTQLRLGSSIPLCHSPSELLSYSVNQSKVSLKINRASEINRVRNLGVVKNVKSKRVSYTPRTEGEIMLSRI